MRGSLSFDTVTTTLLGRQQRELLGMVNEVPRITADDTGIEPAHALQNQRTSAPCRRKAAAASRSLWIVRLQASATACARTARASSCCGSSLTTKDGFDWRIGFNMMRSTTPAVTATRPRSLCADWCTKDGSPCLEADFMSIVAQKRQATSWTGLRDALNNPPARRLVPVGRPHHASVAQRAFVSLGSNGGSIRFCFLERLQALEGNRSGGYISPEAGPSGDQGDLNRPAGIRGNIRSRAYNTTTATAVPTLRRPPRPVQDPLRPRGPAVMANVSGARYEIETLRRAEGHPRYVRVRSRSPRTLQARSAGAGLAQPPAPLGRFMGSRTAVRLTRSSWSWSTDRRSPIGYFS